MKSLASVDPGKVGPYRTIAVLGSGAMGRVLLGGTLSGDRVAIKLVHESLVEDQGFRARFRREVKASRKVSGRHTAAVLADDTAARVPWMATEFVPGLTLAEAVDVGGPFGTDALLWLADGLAAALADIHRAELVHRDLKPANIMLTHDGLKVIDFGIARAVDASTLTGTGTLVGSYAFMSPEQILADAAAPASDVFAFATVLGFAANGFGPFDATTVPAITHRIVSGEPRLGQLSGPVRDLAETCLAKDPDSRPTIADLRSTIDMYQDRPLSPRPWHPDVHERIDALAAEVERYAARTLTHDTHVDPEAVHVPEQLARSETEVTPPAADTEVDSEPSVPRRSKSGSAAKSRPTKPGADGIKAAAYVRELAAKLGVDLGSVSGTGVGGAVTSQNVRDAATAAATARAKDKAEADAARERRRSRERAAKAAKAKLDRDGQREKSAPKPQPRRPATPPTTKTPKKKDNDNAWAVIGVIVLVVIGIILVNRDEDDKGDSGSDDTSASADLAGDGDGATTGGGYQPPPTTKAVDRTAGCSEAFSAIKTYIDIANPAMRGGDNDGAARAFSSLASRLRSAQSKAENSLVATNLGILADDSDRMASALYSDNTDSYKYWREVWTGDRDDLRDSCYG